MTLFYKILSQSLISSAAKRVGNDRKVLVCSEAYKAKAAAQQVDSGFKLIFIDRSEQYPSVVMA